MRRHRTTARGVLLLLLAAGLAGPAAAADKPKAASVPPLVFPVAGPVSYVDDFGQPRAGGAHQGNDLMARKKTPVVAVEPGKVKFWTTSASAGCMLYLYGASGTTYLYIHLNNDLTMQNDNRGKCVPGVSYAPGLKDGAHVSTGQMIGYVGDSGDANGIASHLHFEVHPGGGAAVSPYPYLQTASHLLFYAKPGAPFALALSGTVVSATDTQLTLQLSALQAFPMNLKLTRLTQTLTVAVPATAVIQQKPPATPGARLLSASAGQRVVVWTQPALATTKAMLGGDGALSAALVQLG
ncbi:MAG TPA: M23 family metallopeptidase [Gaiellaceae bacterium]|nr:M23 family metallopeptidase [Gaiellaceae bacterium]